MDINAELRAAGFARVIALDGSECGFPETETILLALWPYEAEKAPATEDAWIHPYYFASQRAYEAAADFAKKHTAQGLTLRDDIRVKPIFSRLPGFSQGRNTLSYTEDYGSRFHVQIFALMPGIPATHHLEAENHALHCGSCRRCIEACPTHALEDGIFHRERCLRNWQMSGQPVPEELRRHMGNLLIGCDVCQAICPHNAPATGEPNPTVPLDALLKMPKETAALLRQEIGVNLTIPNRVLGQACLIAGCSGKKELIPLVKALVSHPSPAVCDHAEWAVEQLMEKTR